MYEVDFTGWTRTIADATGPRTDFYDFLDVSLAIRHNHASSPLLKEGYAFFLGFVSIES